MPPCRAAQPRAPLPNSPPLDTSPRTRNAVPGIASRPALPGAPHSTVRATSDRSWTAPALWRFGRRLSVWSQRIGTSSPKGCRPTGSMPLELHHSDHSEMSPATHPAPPGHCLFLSERDAVLEPSRVWPRQLLLSRLPLRRLRTAFPAPTASATWS